MEQELVTRHENAQAIIKGIANGCKVSFYKTETGTERSRAYEIIVESLGCKPLHYAAVYSLPFAMESFATALKKSLSNAVAQWR